MIISTGYTEIKDSNSLEKFGEKFGYEVKAGEDKIGLYSTETDDTMFFDFKNQLLTIHNADPSTLDSVFCFDSERDGFLSNGDITVLIRGGKVYLKKLEEDSVGPFSTKLKVYAAKHNLSKMSISKAVGVSRISVIKWMSGEYIPAKNLDMVIERLTNLFPGTTEKEWRNSILLSRSKRTLNNLE